MPRKMMNFELPKGQSSIIKVIGVGGGGSNAVNHMYNEGIKGVDFVVCNTDAQALDNSPVPNKIALGSGLTEGLGAGGVPEMGKNAALENMEQIKEILDKSTQMVFVTAGMGGGTGTGGAPVIAAAAKEMGILTVGIVTIPFSNEGPKRKQQAEEGLNQLRDSVDALIIICNDKLREMYGNLTISTAFKKADDVLTTAARGIAEMISVHGMINVDFKDVNTVMKDSGVAIMGSAFADGEGRAVKAVEQALASPLLNDNKIQGARYVLLNVNAGTKEPTLDEISEISDYVQIEAGNTANVIMGVGTDESLEEKISVTIIAAGFDTNPDLGFAANRQPERIVRTLGQQEPPKTIHTLDQPKPDATVGDVPKTVHTLDQAPTEEPVVEEKITQPMFTLDNNTPTEESVVEPPKTIYTLDAKEEATEDVPEVNSESPKVVHTLDRNDEINEEPIVPSRKTIVPNVIGQEEGSTEKEANVPEFKLMKKKPEEESQTTFEFELKPKRPSQPATGNTGITGDNNSAYIAKNPSTPSTPSGSGYYSQNQTQGLDDNIEEDTDPLRTKERVSRLRELSYKSKTYSGVNDMENEPAYKRKQVDLDDVPHSSESSVSRFTLSESEEEDGKATLKPNNPFLHDNVD